MNKKKNDRKSILLSITACVAALFLLFAALVVSEYVKLAKYGLNKKEIVAASYALYEGEPFSSDITYLRTLTKHESSAVREDLIQKKLIFLSQKEINCAMRITFDDGESMVVFVTKQAYGLDYGRVWIKNTSWQSVFGRYN